jgi:hypothetical protein
MENPRDIEIVNYTDKSFAVYGDTKSIKEQLKELGGRFNRNLKGRPGWIFSNKHLSKVEGFLKEDISLHKTIGKTIINQSDSEGDKMMANLNILDIKNDKEIHPKIVYLIYSDVLDKVMGIYTDLDKAKIDAKKLSETDESGIYLLESEANCVKELYTGNLKEINFL